MDFKKSDITLTMKLHLNFGSDGHGYVYDLKVNDKIVGSRHISTGKRPTDTFCIGDAEYDMKTGTKNELYSWMKKQLKERD